MRTGAYAKNRRRKPISRSASRSTAPVSPELRPASAFFDHMLEQLARHSLIDIEIQATGDLHIDQHHTVEDTGIALGQAIRQALGERTGIARFADALLPMDETLTRVAVDVSGRPFLVFKTKLARAKIGGFDTDLVREFFQAFTTHAAMTIHVETLYGENAHHIVLQRSPGRSDSPSYLAFSPLGLLQSVKLSRLDPPIWMVRRERPLRGSRASPITKQGKASCT